MASNSKQTTKIRKRKLAKQGKRRKRILRREGSTPSLTQLLKDESAEQSS